MCDIINFDKFVKDDQKYIQNEHCLFKMPFNSIFYGKTNSGKTNALVNLLLNKKYFLPAQRIYLYASDLQDPKYILLLEHYEKIEINMQKKLKDDKFKMFFCSDKIEDIIPINEYDKKYNNLVIIDDMIHLANSKNHEIINSYFIVGRHYGVSTIYLTQHFFKLDRTIRCNINYLLLFKIVSNYDISSIYRDIMCDITLQEFKNNYRKTIGINIYGFIILNFIAKDTNDFMSNTFYLK